MASRRSGWFANLATLSAAGFLLVGCIGGGDNDPPETPAILATAAPTQEGRSSQQPDVVSNDEDDDVAQVQSTSSLDCAPDVDEAGLMRVDAFREAMNCVVEFFSWPEGKKPDSAIVDGIIDGYMDPENSNFQVGMEYTEVAGKNTCAWNMEWLEAREEGDANREAVALNILLTVIPDPAASIQGYPADGRDESTINHFRRIAEQAELGDPSLVQEQVTRQCGPIEWPES